jgi:TfoX/Sxy family transcriptional regulator of competence genes
MAYDERLAQRVRAALAPRRNVIERRMFGGLCYMVGEHMACGVVEDRLMVRLAPQEAVERLAEPHVKPMDFTGRPLRGFLFVEPEGIRTSGQLTRWIERAASFAESQPPKKTARR